MDIVTRFQFLFQMSPVTILCTGYIVIFLVLNLRVTSIIGKLCCASKNSKSKVSKIVDADCFLISVWATSHRYPYNLMLKWHKTLLTLPFWHLKSLGSIPKDLYSYFYNVFGLSKTLLIELCFFDFLGLSNFFINLFVCFYWSKDVFGSINILFWGSAKSDCWRMWMCICVVKYKES